MRIEQADPSDPRQARVCHEVSDIQRVLDLATLDQAKQARLRGPAERAAAGYSLVSWAGPVPGEFTEGVAAMAVDPEDPGWGHQVITAVTREHRGHRLGLLLKLAMLELLTTAEPQLERMETMNAAGNKHMIAVNDALGYVPSGTPFVSWQLDPAAGT
jgi:hypothetical protein